MKSLFLTQWQTFIRYHELSGSKTTLVYLPGLSVPSVVSFLSVATHPKLREHHAVLIDYLGSGFSDHPQDFDYSIANHAQSVAAILDYEGIRNCAVIGHSMGGTVGIMLAIQRPDLVSNLVVSEGNINPGGGIYSRQVASYSESEFINQVHPAFLEERRQDAISGDTMAANIGGIWGIADPAGIYGNSLALVELEPSFKKQFLQLPIPRTYIYGEKSLPENSGEVRADAPDPKELEAAGIHIAVVSNAGHSMMRDNLSGYVDILQIALEGQQ